jgi:hypothetical protein
MSHHSSCDISRRQLTAVIRAENLSLDHGPGFCARLVRIIIFDYRNSTEFQLE